MAKRQTEIAGVLAHIHAAYQQLQASLTTLAHNTGSQEHKVRIGTAQKDLDRWRVLHWSNITESRPGEFLVGDDSMTENDKSQAV